jgi:hypothetical protein
MTQAESTYIHASYRAYHQALLAEIGRHPGGEIDDLDAELVRQLMSRIKHNGRNGHRIAHYEPGMVWGAGKPLWVNGAPNLLLWIRAQQYRPKMVQIVAEAERLGLIMPDATVLEGGIADQRRQITAPAEYTVRALTAGDNGLLGMPPASKPTTMPAWIDEFPSRGNADEDRILVNCLLHLSEGAALRTIHRIQGDRFAETRRRTEVETSRARASDARHRRINAEDGASAVMAEIARRRAS